MTTLASLIGGNVPNVIMKVPFFGDPIQPVFSSGKKAEEGIMGWHNRHTTVRYMTYCLPVLCVSVNKYYCAIIVP